MTFIGFVAINLAPGNYFDTLKQNPQINPDTIELYKAKYHLDKNVFAQYYYWLINVLKLDFGYSFSYKIPVFSILKTRLFNTLILSLSVFFLSWFLGIPLGVFCAIKKNKFFDKIFSFFSFLAISFPTFFLALIFLYFGSLIGFLPLGGMRSFNYYELNKFDRFLDILKHLIIPTLVLSIPNIAILSRFMRASFLDELNNKYVLFLKAKGLSNKKIYLHVLRNSLNPLISIFGMSISGLLSGAALTEIICNWPGVGSLLLEAILAQDLFLFVGDLLIGGFLLILGYLISDILLSIFDPRIQYQ